MTETPSDDQSTNDDSSEPLTKTEYQTILDSVVEHAPDLGLVTSIVTQSGKVFSEITWIRDISPHALRRSYSHLSPEQETGETQIESVTELESSINQYVEFKSEHLHQSTILQNSMVLKGFKDWCTDQTRTASDDTGGLEFPLDIEAAIDRYIEEHAAQRAEATNRAYRAQLDAFSDWKHTHGVGESSP